MDTKKQRNTKHRWRKSGFTLVEVLIYLVIISLVTVTLVSFANSANFSRSKVYVVQEVQANARAAFDLISSKARLADNVFLPTKGISSSTLVLDMPGLLPDMTFAATAGVLSIQEGGAEPVAVTSNRVNVSSLSFANLSALGERDNIALEITVEYAGAESREYQYSFSLQTTVNLRK